MNTSEYDASSLLENDSDEVEEKLQVPQQYRDDVIELLARLMVQDKRAQKRQKNEEKQGTVTKKDYEVSRVRNHEISVTGKWRFNVTFKGWGNKSWWIEDEDCNCENAIRTYLDDIGLDIPVVYCICRVSTKGQVGPTHVSLEVQEKSLIAKAKSMCGSVVRIKVIRISESAYRGIPKTMAAIGEVARRGDSIFIYRVDRLSRNIFKFLGWLENLNDRGVTFYAQKENLCYAQEKLRFVQCILDANKESESLREKTLALLRYRRERGDEFFGSLPFGWMGERVLIEGSADRTRLIKVENPKEQKIIRLIKSSMEENSAIAERLNARGLKKRGRAWTSGMVRSIKFPPRSQAEEAEEEGFDSKPVNSKPAKRRRL